MTTRTLSPLLALALLSLMTPSPVVNSVFGQAGDPSIDVPSDAMPEPTNPGQAAAEEALREAKVELEEIERRLADDAREMNDRITTVVEDNASLSEKEARLREELRALGVELVKLDEAVYDEEKKLERAETNIAAVQSEIRSQATDLRDRFENSVFSLQYPQFTKEAESLLESEAPLEARLETLLGLLDQARMGASSVTDFRAEVRLADTGSAIEEAQILRLGFLGGFYTTGTENGFIMADPNAEGTLAGRSAGLTPEQSTSIARLIDSPENGGAIPFDVTGGAGLATLQARDSFGDWLEKGGKFMWPLMVVAAVAALMILERAIVLTWRSRGMRRHIDKTIELVGSGDFDRALAYVDKVGGPTGQVLHAALVHHDDHRSVIEDAVQEALLRAAPVFQSRLGFISLCAAVSPLMGLLGTVTGMIGTFTMVTLFGTSDPRFMAGGISEALITTQGGLYLAIPCLLCRGVLGSFAEGSLGRLETGAMSVVLQILETRSDRSAESPVENPVREAILQKFEPDGFEAVAQAAAEDDSVMGGAVKGGAVPANDNVELEDLLDDEVELNGSDRLDPLVSDHEPLDTPGKGVEENDRLQQRFEV